MERRIRDYECVGTGRGLANDDFKTGEKISESPAVDASQGVPTALIQIRRSKANLYSADRERISYVRGVLCDQSRKGESIRF